MSKYCLEVITSECRSLKQLFNSLKDNLTDETLIFDKDGLKILSLNTTHSVLVDLFLEADRFMKYHIDYPNKDETALAVSIHMMAKAFSDTKGTDEVISFIHETEDSPYFIILIQNQAKKQVKRVKLHLLNVRNKKYTLDQDHQYSNLIMMPCVDFSSICKYMKSMDVASVTIGYDGNELRFSGKSNTSKNVIDISRYGFHDDGFGKSGGGEDDLIFRKLTNDKNTEYNDTFQLDKLNNLSKCSSMGTKTLEIMLSNSMPIVLSFKVGSLGSVKFFLAPMSDERTLTDGEE